jgi:uncharacterized small protein (DUF1192 family)
MPEAADGRFAPDDESTVLGSDVSCDREGYWVELTVGFRDEVVRRRIGPYLTEKIARVAAEQIRRSAGRDAPPPTGF